jgi:hypothetical protein
MAWKITSCAAAPEGIVLWLSSTAGDDPADVTVEGLDVREVRAQNKLGSPEDLNGWIGGWGAPDRFEILTPIPAAFTPAPGSTLRLKLRSSTCVAHVLPTESLGVFTPRPSPQDFLDRVSRIASSAERIEVHAGTAAADTGRIANSADEIATQSERIADADEQLVAYPMLTSGADSGLSGPSSLTGAGARALIDKHLKTLVPNVPRDNDPNRLEAAILRATEPVVTNGITTYVPRSNPYGTADTSVGEGLAGAQASMVVFAQAQLQASLTLLDSLESLDVTSDPEVVAADTAILRRTWLDFVNELSRDGGPRVQRTNALANNLDGLADDGVNPNPVLDDNNEPVNFVDTLGEELGMLARDPITNARVPNRAPLNPLNVVTVDEEKAITDFETLQALIQGATATWRRLRGQISTPLALGVGLVRLRRLFAVLGESVDEAGAAFDSVFFDDDQRRSQPIGPPPEATTVQDLFEWLSSFATEEGPDLVHEGGTRGIDVVHDTTVTVLGTLASFQAYINAGAPAVLRHPRVTNALTEIDTCLQNIEQATQ